MSLPEQALVSQFTETDVGSRTALDSGSIWTGAGVQTDVRTGALRPSLGALALIDIVTLSAAEPASRLAPLHPGVTVLHLAESARDFGAFGRLSEPETVVSSEFGRWMSALPGNLPTWRTHPQVELVVIQVVRRAATWISRWEPFPFSGGYQSADVADRSPDTLGAAVTVDPSARYLWTGELRAVAEQLVRLIQEEARRREVPVAGVAVHRFVDPEDSGEELVITQRVRLRPESALAYWETLGTALEAWTGKLSPVRAKLAIERIAINIDWSGNAV